MGHLFHDWMEKYHGEWLEKYDDVDPKSSSKGCSLDEFLGVLRVYFAKSEARQG
jgi:hypothetical protein